MRIGADAKLGLFVKHLKDALTKKIHLQNPNLSVWQSGFFDHLLRSGESYGEKWEYVRQNPVRAGLAAHPDEWLFQGEIADLQWTSS